MTTIIRDSDLVSGTATDVDWTQTGWETCAATGGGAVIYTFNWGAVYSDDEGQTFHPIDANGLCAVWSKSLAGDQVISYIPEVGHFVWVILTTNMNLVVAAASAEDILASRGTAWTTWLLKAADYGGSQFDRPTISVGDIYVFIGVNRDRVSVGIQLSINEISAGDVLHPRYFVAPGVFWLEATQNTGGTGYFAALMNVKAENGQDYLSNVRVFGWERFASVIPYFDVPISAVPTAGGTVRTPSSADWLANGRGSLQILGLTRRGNELWAAWVGNRSVPNPPPGVQTLSFPYPHIGIAVIDLDMRALKEQLFIWNRDEVFVFPDLATNGRGEVGLAYCGGGEHQDPQFGVGLLTWPAVWPSTSLVSLTPVPSTAAGGDYISIRRTFPDEATFCAAGFNQMPPGPASHPHYVLFRS